MKRHDLLRALHDLTRPRNYLEIGVDDGRSLTLSRVPSIAIDPAFRITFPVRCDLHLAKATSDAFFAAKDPIRHLRSSRNPLRNARHGRPLLDHWRGGTTLDLVFIDGMHIFEFALRDFMNVERFSRWSSVTDPQDVPREVLERVDAVSPEALLGAGFWPAIVAGRHRAAGGHLDAIRREVAGLPRARRRA
jgi:hypothetical protein